MVGSQRDSGESEVVGDSLSFSARHNEGRARSGAASMNAAAASKTVSASASAFRCDASCQRAFTSCPARNLCLYRAFRSLVVLERKLVCVEALGELHAMSRLRECESEAFVARVSRGVIRTVSRRVCQEPVRAAGRHGDGEGMVKSRAYRCDQNRLKTFIPSPKHSLSSFSRTRIWRRRRVRPSYHFLTPRASGAAGNRVAFWR